QSSRAVPELRTDPRKRQILPRVNAAGEGLSTKVLPSSISPKAGNQGLIAVAMPRRTPPLGLKAGWGYLPHAIERLAMPPNGGSELSRAALNRPHSSASGRLAHPGNARCAEPGGLFLHFPLAAHPRTKGECHSWRTNRNLKPCRATCATC